MLTEMAEPASPVALCMLRAERRGPTMLTVTVTVYADATTEPMSPWTSQASVETMTDLEAVLARVHAFLHDFPVTTTNGRRAGRPSRADGNGPVTRHIENRDRSIGRNS
jgi:hypothetical protein